MQLLTYNFDQRIEQSILLLREQKHQAGFPFMIEGMGELPNNQAYMEYADGSIEVVAFSANYQDYYTIRKLTEVEIKVLHQRYHLENA
jgi:hypothetical protein